MAPIASLKSGIFPVIIIVLACLWIPSLGASEEAENVPEMTSPDETTNTTTVATTPERNNRYAEIVFDDLYHLEFPRNRLRRFQACMCNSFVEACIIEYEDTSSNSQNFEDGYRFVAQQPLEFVFSTPENDDIPFLCHPGGFTAFDTMACVRVRDTEERCRHQTCRIVHVADLPRSCSVGCITVVWLGYSVSFRNFTDNREFEDGVCGDSTASTSDHTPTPTQPPQLTSASPEQEAIKDLGDSNDDSILTIVAAVGWALVFLMAVAVISFFIYRHKTREKREEKTPIVSSSQQNHDAPESPREVPSLPLGNHTNSPSTNTQRYETPRSSSFEESMPYTDLEDVYTYIEDEEADGPMGASKLGQNGGVSQSNRQPIHESNLKIKDNTVGVVSEKHQQRHDYANDAGEKSSNAEPTVVHVSPMMPDQDDDMEERYKRFDSGRHGQSANITDSFLATYDVTTEPDGGKTESSSEEEKPEKLKEPETEETSTDLSRDSGGYTQVSKGRSFKDHTETKEKTDDASMPTVHDDHEEEKPVDNQYMNENGDNGASPSSTYHQMSASGHAYEMAQPIIATRGSKQ